MITKKQFEAHVREQAEAKYPSTPDSDGVSYKASWRAAHVAARMEHEWPLVEALQDLHDTAIDARALVAGQQTPIDRSALIILLTERLSHARAILAPYTTTKPTEQR